MSRHVSALALLIALAVSPRPVYAEWSWLHPQPQGHTLYDIVFLDNSAAVAVGEFGTVLVTHDTGESWSVSSQVASITTDLLRVERLGPSIVLAVGEDGVIVRSLDGGTTWTQIASGTSVPLVDVSFADATHGIAVGGTTVLRTSDGGLSWASTTVSSLLYSVHAVSPSRAFAGGGQGALLVTSDGGATWSPTLSPMPAGNAVAITGLDFMDELNGVIAATSGRDALDNPIKSIWYLTSDGGATWSQVEPFATSNPSAQYTPREVLLRTIDEVFGACEVDCCNLSAQDPAPTGDLVVSTNAGADWTHNSTSHAANGIASNNDGVVLAVGGDGIIYRREIDGSVARIGGTPQYHHGGSSASSFLGTNAGIVMSSDDFMYPLSRSETNFAHTTNQGVTWQFTSVANVQGLDLVQLPSSDIYVSAIDLLARAILLRSTDGGSTWTQIWTGSQYQWYGAIAGGTSTRAVAVGDNGAAIVIDNGVVTPVATGASVRLTGVAFASPTVVVAIGGTVVLRSLDGGQTWAPTAGPSPGLTRIAFATPTTAFGVSSSGIYRSEDTGDTWTLVEPATDLSNIDFADAVNGVAVGGNGAALITRNGGNTWESMNAPTNRAFNDVTVVSTDHAFVSGSQLVLFEYNEVPVPTLISYFDAVARDFAAELRWEVGDDENLSRFIIRRWQGEDETEVSDALSGGTRSFRDEGLQPGLTYRYQLFAVDSDGWVAAAPPVWVTIPEARVELLPNLPNPFNPSTVIRFVVAEKGPVRVSVYDIAGHSVAVLLNDVRDPGMYSVEWNAGSAASGVYLCRLQEGNTSVSRKLVLLK